MESTDAAGRRQSSETQVIAGPRIARWTLPLWLYVCVTGVVICLIL